MVSKDSHQSNKITGTAYVRGKREASWATSPAPPSTGEQPPRKHTEVKASVCNNKRRAKAPSEPKHRRMFGTAHGVLNRDVTGCRKNVGQLAAVLGAKFSAIGLQCSTLTYASAERNKGARREKNLANSF